MPRKAPCHACKLYRNEAKHLEIQVRTLKQQLYEVQCERDTFKSQWELQQLTLSVDYNEIQSNYVEGSKLRLQEFQTYLIEVKQQFPIIGYVCDLFLSQSHKDKLQNSSTNPKWKLWSALYQSWIADTFLRARSPKTVHRTTLFVSSFLLLGNISEPCWRLLQRLRIVVSKETTERWIREESAKPLLSNSSTLIHVFDNCDFLVCYIYTPKLLIILQVASC